MWLLCQQVLWSFLKNQSATPALEDSARHIENPKIWNVHELPATDDIGRYACFVRWWREKYRSAATRLITDLYHHPPTSASLASPQRTVYIGHKLGPNILIIPPKITLNVNLTGSLLIVFIIVHHAPCSLAYINPISQKKVTSHIQ